MIEIRCPACGDHDPVRDDDLPHSPGAIPLRCTKCAQVWERQPRIVCGHCGSSDVDVSGYLGWAFDDADEARDDPSTAAWSYLDRSIMNCRHCRHRWTAVEGVHPHPQRI